jgi:monoamine oxidase
LPVLRIILPESLSALRAGFGLTMPPGLGLPTSAEGVRVTFGTTVARRKVVRIADVAIVGGGAAGLAAARDLAAGGLEVVVIEARERLGGRIETLRRPDAAVPVELGAEFVHGTPKETLRVVDSGRLVAVRIPDVHWFRTPRGLEKRDFWRPVAGVLSRVPRSGRDVSAAEFLRSRAARAGGRLATLVRSFIEGYHAAALDDVSARSIAMDRNEREDGRAQFRILDGQDRVIEWLRSGAEPGAVEWRTGSPVTRIEWRAPGGVTLTDALGARVRASTALVTVPVGVLKAGGGARGAIGFEPALPAAKRRALASLAMGCVVKIVFRFDEPFWEREGFMARRRPSAAGDGLVFLHAPGAPFPTWWSSAPARSTLLTAWAGGPAAQRLRAGKAPPAEIALSALAELLEIPRRSLAARVASADSRDWTADPYARGAYSHALPGGAGAARALGRPVGGRLFFAGEATSSEETGTVAGAIASGRRAAREIAIALGSGRRRKGKA